MFYISVIRTTISISLQELGRHIVFMSSMSPRMSSQGRWRKQRASCIGLTPRRSSIRLLGPRDGHVAGLAAPTVA
jgi:hypothetical protein